MIPVKIPSKGFQSRDSRNPLPHQPTMWTFVPRGFQECLHLKTVQNIQMRQTFPNISKQSDFAALSDFYKLSDFLNFRSFRSLSLSVSFFRRWMDPSWPACLEAGPRFRTAGFLTICDDAKSGCRESAGITTWDATWDAKLHGEPKGLWILLFNQFCVFLRVSRRYPKETITCRNVKSKPVTRFNKRKAAIASLARKCNAQIYGKS